MRLGFVHVGQDLEEQQELVECLLAFFLHFLLADDAISCLLPGVWLSWCAKLHLSFVCMAGAMECCGALMWKFNTFAYADVPATNIS